MSTTQYINVPRTLQNLENSEIHSDNVDAIIEFIDHCAAEGISECRQQRHAQSLKSLLKKFAPDDFLLKGATEQELKTVIAGLNRSDYADATKRTMRGTVKKFYRVTNEGHEHPDKVKFISLKKKKPTQITRDDLFTDDELKRLFRGFSNTRDRAFTMILYESAARPGELLARNIGDFTSNEKGDFIFLEGSKGTPDRTNQLIRAGRTLREWLAQHPLGGELGDIQDSNAPLWVKNEQQACQHCGDVPHNHDDENCGYEPDVSDRMKYKGFLRRFKDACERAEIPDNKRRPYNLRHTRLTEVATFMGYEQLNKFAGWKPGSDRAKVYVHLNNDDVNKAIREEYGIDTGDNTGRKQECPYCGTENEAHHSECRICGRPLSLQKVSKREEKQDVLERLNELEKNGVLDKLQKLEAV